MPAWNQLPPPFDNPYLFVLLVLWTIIWKGIALWRAGRNDQLVWFIALLILNTVGLLEIIYLAFFQRRPAVPVE